MGAIYFELAPWSSMRLCLQLEKTFPDLRGWQVELMKQLCFVAYDCEIYDGVGREGWLRTTVSLPQLQSECNRLDPCIFSEESAECDVMGIIAEHCRTNTACETYWSEVQELHRELVTRVKIHSNIIPRKAYREKLNEVLRRQQQGSFPPRTFRREFYPIGVLADEGWRRNGGQCVLASYLNTPDVPHAIPRGRLRQVNQKEVSTTMTNPSGAVQEVSWRNGIYARKSFYKAYIHVYETERDVALRVSHPHVIRPICETCDVNGNPCLLMEWLGSNLDKVFIEQSDFAGGEQPLVEDSVESLDVLLQIARGLKALHDVHVVHGDLKPQNILFSHFEISEGVRHFLVKIADFGEAQVVSSAENFKPSNGTTGYAAPEVLKWTRLKLKDIPFCDPKKHDVDSLPYKLDIYSFGCVAYEVLTGQQVYGNGSFSQADMRRVVEGTLTPDCFNEQRKCTKWKNMKKIYPIDLIHCLESCWAYNPSERPSSSRLCEVLERSTSEMQRLVAWKERRKYVLWNLRGPSLITFFCCFAARYIDSEKFWNWLENLAVVIAAVPSLIASFCCFAASYIDPEKFWNWLENLAVLTTAMALVGFVCICCHRYSGKLKKK